MGERILAIIGATIVAALLAFHSPASYSQADRKTETKTASVPWSKVPNSERKVLSPLEKDWTQLPGVQQRKLLGAAKKYPGMAPIQQERFQERLKEWSALTPEERHAARDKYKNLSSLPPAKQYELREKWQEKTTQSKGPAANSPTSATPPSQ